MSKRISTARQIKLLDKLSGLLDLARAEIIRRAIDEYVDKREERESQFLRDNKS